MLKSFRVSGLILALAVVVNCSNAFACVEYSQYRFPITEFEIPDNSTYDFCVHGNYAFYAVEEHGLAISDIGDASKMEVIGSNDSIYATCVSVEPA